MLFWILISWKRADQEIESLLGISTSWSKIQPPEKVEFWSHEIWPPDPESHLPSCNSVQSISYFHLGSRTVFKLFSFMWLTYSLGNYLLLSVRLPEWITLKFYLYFKKSISTIRLYLCTTSTCSGKIIVWFHLQKTIFNFYNT